MTPHDVINTAHGLMAKYGLTALGWKFKLDNAKKRAGLCRHGYKTVSLSKHYVAMNANSRPDDVIDTILHEIAHALVGPGHGHDEVWRDMCITVGAKPIRCYDSNTIVMPSGNLQATCGGCSTTFKRHKVKQARLYCAHCGPDKGQLKFVPTFVAQSTIAPITPSRLRGT